MTRPDTPDPQTPAWSQARSASFFLCWTRPISDLHVSWRPLHCAQGWCRTTSSKGCFGRPRSRWVVVGRPMSAVLAQMSLSPSRRQATPSAILSGCVEGEWHTLPLRMLGTSLAADGHDFTFLGPSLAADRFARSLNDLHATSVLLSCAHGRKSSSSCSSVRLP
jgi:hypothetical protein